VSNYCSLKTTITLMLYFQVIVCQLVLALTFIAVERHRSRGIMPVLVSSTRVGASPGQPDSLVP
jgi:hypothetical protein